MARSAPRVWLLVWSHDRSECRLVGDAKFSANRLQLVAYRGRCNLQRPGNFLVLQSVCGESGNPLLCRHKSISTGRRGNLQPQHFPAYWSLDLKRVLMEAPLDAARQKFHQCAWQRRWLPLRPLLLQQQNAGRSSDGKAAIEGCKYGCTT